MIVLDSSKQAKKTSVINVEGPFGTHDTLREGIKSFAHDLAPKHPLQNRLKTNMDEDDERKKIIAERTLGLHMGFRLDAEKSIFQQTSRLAGLPSSNLSYEILTGRDEDFDISDVLNRTSKTFTI